MAKKIELLHTTYDESGNIESQEVVHPLTSPDCIIMENGKTLDEVMGDGIATPTLTHEGTSFKVGVGDSNIEVVDGDVAGMTLKGQSYQNILPKPTTLIMETDEKEFKINDKIDSNIIIDDNIAEIAAVKGKTIVNTVQEESASEYTVLGEDLSGQSIVTTNKLEGNIKGVTLQGQTLVNTIQEPCEDDYVVLGADDGIEISAETGGHGTIEDTVQGGINGAVLEGMTLINTISNVYDSCHLPVSQEVSMSSEDTTWDSETYRIKAITFVKNMLPNVTYLIKLKVTELTGTDKLGSYIIDTDGNMTYSIANGVLGENNFIYTPTAEIKKIAFYLDDIAGKTASIKEPMVIEYQDGMEDWDIPYFEGLQSVKMPVLTTTGKNLFDKSKTLENCALDGTSDVVLKGWKDYFVSDYIPVKKNEPIFIPYTGSSRKIYCDKNKEYVRQITNSDSYFTPEFDGFIRLTFLNVDLNTYQLEYNTQATSYEPHKSNILTVNEDVVLRGIGDVKDELDLQTGKLTQRIEEIVLDGSQNFQVSTTYTNTLLIIFNEINTQLTLYDECICDKLRCVTVSSDDYEHMRINANGNICLWINKTKFNTQDITGVRNYLLQNPITVQYPLVTESVKTIDLQVTNQDNNTIPHIQTQPTVTHITASSDYLIPTATINGNLAYDTIIKPSTLYTVRFKHNTVNTDNPLTVDLGGTTQTVTSTEFTITTPSELTHNQLVFSGKNNVVSEVQVIEGNVVGTQYPFFEGMNDVQITDMNRNVNLFDMNDTVPGFLGGNGKEIKVPDHGNLTSNYIKVKPDTTYVYNHGGFTADFADYWTGMYFYQDNIGTESNLYTGGSHNRFVYTGQGKQYANFKFTTPADCEYIRIGSRGLSYDGAWATLYQLDNFDDSKIVITNCPFIFGKGGRL